MKLNRDFEVKKSEFTLAKRIRNIVFEEMTFELTSLTAQFELLNEERRPSCLEPRQESLKQRELVQSPCNRSELDLFQEQ